MRKLLTIAVVALTAALGAGPAEAQVRINPSYQQNPKLFVPRVQKTPRVQKVPRVQKTPRVQQGVPVNPKVILIPPSVALKRAIGNVPPGAKPLGVKLRGDTYIVRLKSGGTITQLGVNSVTGAISRIP